MPWPTPRTLSDSEVYALVAYLLAENKIIAATDEMNAQTLPKVKMPNANGFTGDPRPDIFAVPCRTDCK